MNGIPSTSVARTLFDLCGDIQIHPDRAARALDTALARRYVTIPALWRVLDDLAERGRRGTVWMRTLLMERGGRYVPPESELEARFIGLVHRYRLPRPERQVDLGDADRDQRLAALGWTVLRFRWADVVETPLAVAHAIRRALHPAQGVQGSPKRAG